MRTSHALTVAMLVAASLLPLAGAHWDQSVLPGLPTDNVAGTVAGFAGPEVVGTSGTNLVARGLITCDLEVAGPGDRWTRAHEAEVDENPNPLATTVPDNVWNDGGQGGACHVGSYALDDFNTIGCSGEARASVGVYVTAACDAGTVGGGNALPTVDDALGTGVCAANEVTTARMSFITCLAPLTTSTSGFANCNNDGSADVSNTGYATPSVGPAVPLVSCAVEADTDGSTAAILVHSPVVDLRGGTPSTTATATTHVWAT